VVDGQVALQPGLIEPSAGETEAVLAMQPLDAQITFEAGSVPDVPVIEIRL